MPVRVQESSGATFVASSGCASVSAAYVGSEFGASQLARSVGNLENRVLLKHLVGQLVMLRDPKVRQIGKEGLELWIGLT